MKTLEHEIRDVLNNKINLYDETLLEELALELYESGDINFDDENEDEYLTEAPPLALPLIPIIVGAARLGLSTAGKQFIGGLIKKAPEIAKQIGNAIKSGGNSARNLINRINRSVARARVKSKRKSSQNRASGRGIGRRFLRMPSSSSNGSSSSGVSSRPSRETERTIEMHGDGREGKVITYKESREDIEATPRFVETDREKIDVVPRAENDLETANRKRFRLENIKKKIIDDEFNIRNEFNNFLIEENIELTEEEYDEAFDILFHYFVHDLNENIGSTLYKGAKKTLGFVVKRVLPPAFYASDAVEKYKKGDTSGALTSGAKTVASVTPIGAAASLAHDAYEARKDIADVAKRGYNYVRKSLFGKPKPSNKISQNRL